MNIARQYKNDFMEEVMKPKPKKEEIEEKVSAKKGRGKGEVEKTSVTMRIDSDVLVFFKEMGAGYQTRINTVLREYMERDAG